MDLSGSYKCLQEKLFEAEALRFFHKMILSKNFKKMKPK